MRADAPLVAVCGASAASDEQQRVAYRCGELLAGRGIAVVNGGLGGVMAATAAGVRAAGGVCVGLLPGADSHEANDGVTVALATGMGEMRNALIARVADAMIAIGGGWGTLSEIAFAARLGKPVATIGSWELRPPDGAPVPADLHRAPDSDDAVAWVCARLELAARAG